MNVRCWTILLAAILTLSISGSQISENGCPVGWDFWSSFCYGVFRVEGNFPDAQSACASYQGNLVSFWSQGEWDFIINHQNVSGSSFWIGRTKIPYTGDLLQHENGTWNSSDGSVKSFYIEWAIDADPGVVVTNFSQCLATIVNVTTGNSSARERQCSDDVEAFVCKKPLPYVFEMGSMWLKPPDNSPSYLRVIHRGNTDQASLFFREEDVRPILANSTTIEDTFVLREGFHHCAALCLLYHQCTYFVSYCTTSSGCELFECRLLTL